MIEIMYKNVKENNYNMGVCGIKYFDENNKLFKIEIPNKKMNKKFFEYNIFRVLFGTKFLRQRLLKRNENIFSFRSSISRRFKLCF